MQRYFFNLSDGYREEDHEGVVLPDLASARAAAITFAGELLQHSPELLSDGQDLRVDVTDDQSRHLFLLRISTLGHVTATNSVAAEGR